MATYELIASNVLTTTASSVTFSSIPSTYTDLVLLISARSNAASKIVDCSIRIGNGSVSTSSIYTYQELAGNGSSASSGSGTTDKFNTIMNGDTTTANTFSNVQVYLPNYNSANNKSLSTDAIIESNENVTQIQTRLQAWFWASTAAINIIELFPASGSFMSASSFYLYGIKNS
jgi:hypothetical protein